MHSYAPLASNSGKQYGAIREGESLRPCCHRLRNATNKSACEPYLVYIVITGYSSKKSNISGTLSGWASPWHYLTKL